MTAAVDASTWAPPSNQLTLSGLGPHLHSRAELRGAGGRPIAWVLQHGRVKPIVPDLRES